MEAFEDLSETPTMIYLSSWMLASFGHQALVTKLWCTQSDEPAVRDCDAWNSIKLFVCTLQSSDWTWP